MKASPKVLKAEKNPEADEIIAASILDISEALKKILNGPLKMKTVVILLAHETKLSQRDIERILWAMKDLRTTYCK